MAPQSAALMADYNRWMNERLFVAGVDVGVTDLLARIPGSAA